MGLPPPHDRRLGPLSQEVLAVLIDATDPGEGISRGEAIAVIERANGADDDRLWEREEPQDLTAEVEDLLESLLNRGFLYAVDDELYVTERDVIADQE